MTNRPMIKMQFQLESGESITVVFFDNNIDRSQPEQPDFNLLWWYENNYCFANLFYYTKEILFVSINDNPATLEDVRILAGIPENDQSDDVWTFDPEYKVEILYSKKPQNEIRMTLSTDKIKKEIAKIDQVSEKDLKRVSKTKNEVKQIERVFEVKNSVGTYIVTTDPKDEVILEIKRGVKSEKSPEDFKKNISKMGTKYIFSLSTRDAIENGLLPTWQSIVIVEKSFWKEEQCVQDQTPEIIPYLPKYIGDVNESSVNVVWFEPGEPQLTDLEIIKDIEGYGLKYSNELAQFMEDTEPGAKYYKKVGETYQVK